MSHGSRRSASQERIGQSLAGGKYTLEALVGEGGMGALYRARHTVLERAVAIKLLHPELTADPNAEGRFLREARAASMLDHPASIQILDFGSEDGTCYIVMELLSGRDLAELLAAEGPLEPRRAVSLMSQVLAAVGAAHERGIVHRDLKPENIMVLDRLDDDGETERVKVLDFGIAKIASSGEGGSRALTADGQIFGTPEYMSPEQARGLPLDPRSDLYSCGVIVFRMLTGKLPFLGEHQVGTLMQHITEPPPRPSSLRPDVPPLLEEVVLRALAKSPDERFEDARSMRAALSRSVGEERVSLIPEASAYAPTKRSLALSPMAMAPTVSSSKAPSRAWRVGLVVAVLAMIVGLAFAVWTAVSSEFPVKPRGKQPRAASALPAAVPPGETSTGVFRTSPDDTVSSDATPFADDTVKSRPRRSKRRSAVVAPSAASEIETAGAALPLATAELDSEEPVMAPPEVPASDAIEIPKEETSTAL